MFYLMLAVLSSTIINTGVRFSQGRAKNATTMLCVNYVVCTAISAIQMIGGPGWSGDGSQVALWLGAANGVIYLFGLLTTQTSTRNNGVVMTSVFSRLGGLLVPLVIAVAVFGDRPGAYQMTGALIAVAAIVGMNIGAGGKAGEASSIGTLAALFMANGIGNATAKIYGVYGSPERYGQYLLLTFGVALLLCTALAYRRGERVAGSDVLFGTIVGVPNYFASHFMLKALETVPAYIAYPTQGVSIIAALTLAGVIMFGERLSKSQWVSLGAVMISVVLLNM